MEIRKTIVDNKLSLMEIVETKVRLQNLHTTTRKCLPAEWDSITYINNGVAARIIFVWNRLLCKVSMVDSSEQHVTCRVEHAHTLHPSLSLLFLGTI